VQWLFLDLNAFFASCEQQETPALRGKPVIVVQTLTDSAVAIAASYAAKALGIKTGTLVHEARRLCPAVIAVQANHRLYSDDHERILKAVDTCLPVEKVCSIDEWPASHALSDAVDVLQFAAEQNFGQVIFGDDDQPVRLLQVGPDLAEKHIGRDADR
jgi:nucleotidyltransferase/DNA polymerase involved in DNA repair